jgi:putative colanic acid biosynthesis acetyltransferase WcaF
MTRIVADHSPFSRRLQAARVLWGIVQATVFGWSPVRCFGWRRLLLRLFGGSIAGRVRVYPTTKIWGPWNLVLREGACLASEVECYCVDRIEVGVNSTVSVRTFLCTASHDVRDPAQRLITSPLRIGDDVLVFAEAFIGPGVEIGEGAVVGARGVVVRDVAPWTIVAGNPAKVIGQRSFGAAADTAKQAPLTLH